MNQINFVNICFRIRISWNFWEITSTFPQKNVIAKLTEYLSDINNVSCWRCNSSVANNLSHRPQHQLPLGNKMNYAIVQSLNTFLTASRYIMEVLRRTGRILLHIHINSPIAYHLQKNHTSLKLKTFKLG